MQDWISWLTQHPLGRWTVLTGVLALAGYALRLIWCELRLRRLRQALEQLPAGQPEEVTRAFEQSELEPLRSGWVAYRTGLVRSAYSGPLALQAWTPGRWATRLLGPAWLGWLAPLLLVSAPGWASWGVWQGWQRFQRELIGLTSLQPWEGLRALTIVRHASQSLVNWSQPLVSAGLACALVGGLLLLARAGAQLFLSWRLQRLGTRIRLLFPPQSASNQLDEMQRQLDELTQLIRDLRAEIGIKKGADPQVRPLEETS